MHTSAQAPDSGIVTVVGIGADGWPGLTDAARDALSEADVVLGGDRQLALLPGAVNAHRRPWPSPMLPALPELLADRHRVRLAVLASGDPMFYGVGSSIVAELGSTAVRVLPAVSSVSLACARLGWPLQEIETVSVVGRPLATVTERLRDRLLVLLGVPAQAGEIAARLTSLGLGESELTVLSQLGSSRETVSHTTAADWADTDVDPLTVLAIETRSGVARLSRAPGRDEAAFRQDGQITKREVRAVTVAALGPLPGDLMWDVGAGSGSVGIEWLRVEPGASAIAIEPRPDRLADIEANAAALGVGLRVVAGTAPDALAELPVPDAVFLGGGVSEPGVLEACLAALRPGGRLVANGVTLQTELLLGRWHLELGGELTRIAVQRAGPVGEFTGWRAAMPITQWRYRKGASQ